MHHMQKVKAHQAAPAQETHQAKVKRLGNDWADVMAKRGAELHPGPDPATAAVLGQAWLDATVACRALGEATQLWPDASGMRGDQRRQPTTRAEREQRAIQRRARARARRQHKRD